MNFLHSVNFSKISFSPCIDMKNTLMYLDIKTVGSGRRRHTRIHLLRHVLTFSSGDFTLLPRVAQRPFDPRKPIYSPLFKSFSFSPPLSQGHSFWMNIFPLCHSIHIFSSLIALAYISFFHPSSCTMGVERVAKYACTSV